MSATSAASAIRAHAASSALMPSPSSSARIGGWVWFFIDALLVRRRYVIASLPLRKTSPAAAVTGERVKLQLTPDVSVTNDGGRRR